VGTSVGGPVPQTPWDLSHGTNPRDAKEGRRRYRCPWPDPSSRSLGRCSAGVAAEPYPPPRFRVRPGVPFPSSLKGTGTGTPRRRLHRRPRSSLERSSLLSTTRSSPRASQSLALRPRRIATAHHERPGLLGRTCDQAAVPAARARYRFPNPFRRLGTS